MTLNPIWKGTEHHLIHPVALQLVEWVFIQDNNITEGSVVHIKPLRLILLLHKDHKARERTYTGSDDSCL